MPNGGLPNCLECKHKNVNDICDLYGIKASPFLLCRQFKFWNNDLPANDHTRPYLDPFQAGWIYCIDNTYGATQDDPMPVFKIMPIRHLDTTKDDGDLI